jgi:DNA-directed RNA polymerase sigma subunit (sigma70/sigma32)
MADEVITLDAVAKRAKVKLETAKAFETARADYPTRLDAPLCDEGGRESEESVYAGIADNSFPAPDTEVLRWDDRNLVATLLEAATPPLTEKERAVVDLRFGLTDGIERRLEEVAADLSISYDMAKQHSAAAMGKLRSAAMTLPEVQNALASATWKIKQGAKQRSIREQTQKAADART